jgi:DNA-binding transcriptional regulator GbsR (MarR family)
MTRDQIKNATGISGAMVLRAIHELARENLVIYDENTSKVKLVKRFY